jgi:hypothetical protein
MRAKRWLRWERGDWAEQVVQYSVLQNIFTTRVFFSFLCFSCQCNFLAACFTWSYNRKVVSSVCMCIYVTTGSLCSSVLLNILIVLMCSCLLLNSHIVLICPCLLLNSRILICSCLSLNSRIRICSCLLLNCRIVLIMCSSLLLNSRSFLICSCLLLNFRIVLICSSLLLNSRILICSSLLLNSRIVLIQPISELDHTT